jgi:hypothetical protein
MELSLKKFRLRRNAPQAKFFSAVELHFRSVFTYP